MDNLDPCSHNLIREEYEPESDSEKIALKIGDAVETSIVAIQELIL